MMEPRGRELIFARWHLGVLLDEQGQTKRSMQEACADGEGQLRKELEADVMSKAGVWDLSSVSKRMAWSTAWVPLQLQAC